MRICKAAVLLLALLFLCSFLAACSTPAPARPTDPAIAAAAKRGQSAFRSGRYGAGAEAYAAALARARMLNEKTGSVDSAYNLAACFAALGRFEEARAALREARSDMATGDAGMADALLLEGVIARKQGRRDEALALAKEVLAMKLPEPGGAARTLQAHLLSQETHCDAGDVAAEHPSLLAVAKAAGDGKLAPGLRADAGAVIGRILRLQGSPAAAAERYDAAAEQYRRAVRPRDIAATLALAGACLEEAGSPSAAADRYYRAARSFHAQNEYAEAVRMLHAVFGQAEKTGDLVTKARAEDLLKEVEVAVKAAGTGR